MLSNIHERYMRYAIMLAKKAEGYTSPNPIVGSLVVKNGRIVGKGYHKKAGSAHAEVYALREAGILARGSTLYVTLEPCSHFGRTPPCTDAIIQSGVKKIVIGMKDPNPINNGRGIRTLRRHGIDVVIGILEKEARSINKPYIKFITKKIPYVTVKVAQSLDGKIATKTGESRWISSPSSRRYVHDIRSRVDAVMVGAGTAIRDNPLLLSVTSRLRQPIRIIVDSKLKISTDAKIFSTTDASPVVIATTSAADKRKRAVFTKNGIELISVDSKNGMVDLRRLLKALAQKNIMHILVEGGSELIGSLFEERLIDRFLIFIAPKIIGGKEAPGPVGGAGVGRIKDALAVSNFTVNRFDDDILFETEVK